ncbi:hypothetical protein HZQ12_14170 [Elizabethkingia anophelis]|uniref:hypothetical protein n=1 Tax=Elizabethkingia anophelis TaxID=1117645 RepID=UPI0021A3DBC3|nr:hypothetical protein [Elizabethkingia anophelis]MCT3978046.1 hypothetical protein [Elizabethkingia anophelis]MCT4041844.1 hypothetical protein [Elizabethkingia anophelis]
MERIKLQEIINKYYNDIFIPDIVEINSFVMDREYFLDIFQVRYEISIEINRPIKGLEETLNTIRNICETKIQSTSIEGSNINLIIYTNSSFNEIYGIVNFFK